MMNWSIGEFEDIEEIKKIGGFAAFFVWEKEEFVLFYCLSGDIVEKEPVQNSHYGF
ncbi:MAG: hypothetical protein K5668_01110 [Lachnospiraceae bacterium]|nr:hypothetical protein [Lachnospiraceae bacterium]